jgi:hypothetical protein
MEIFNFNHRTVSQCRGNVAFLRRVPGLRFAFDVIPLAIVSASKNAIGEVSRQTVDELIRQGRLDIFAARIELTRSGAQGTKCLQLATPWLKENPAAYTKPRKFKLPPSSMSA